MHLDLELYLKYARIAFVQMQKDVLHYRTMCWMEC